MDATSGMWIFLDVCIFVYFPEMRWGKPLLITVYDTPRGVCGGAASWKVVDLIPDGLIGIAYWLNLSSRTVALGSLSL